jgi:putative transposase
MDRSCLVSGCGSGGMSKAGARVEHVSRFRGTHRRPTWRRRGRHEGFRIVGAQALRVRHDNRRGSAVLVPKVGWVKVRRSRALPEWKSYRVSRDPAGRWHLAFAAVPEPVPAPGAGEVVGVDRGVATAVATSTGEMTSPAGLRPKEAERLRRLQRRLARARKGSNRRARVKAAIARLKAREADRRRDWVEKTSTDLARRFDVIRLEDLDVAAMTRSAKGTVDVPGRNVRANKSQAEFGCTSCGLRCHADTNAARNIAAGNPAAGRAVAARGDQVKSARSVKREPQRNRPPQVA